MFKKIVILSIFIAVIVFVSGCIDDKNINNTINTTNAVTSEQIPTINLPSGFTFMAVHEIDVNIGNSSRKATEGVYRTDTGEDIYIQVFKSESPQAIMDEYKAAFNDTGYDPFTEIYFNGHKATKVMFYSTKDGQSIQKYTIIWTTGDSFIKAGPSIEAQKVINLATATNS